MVLAVFITISTFLQLDSLYMFKTKSKPYKTKDLIIDYYYLDKSIRSLRRGYHKSINNKLFHHRIIKISKNEHKRFN